MNFDLSDEQKMLKEQADGLLQEFSSPDRLRELIDAKKDCDDQLWGKLAEMGFLGAVIPETYDGLGLSDLDLGVISEALGRANAAVPFFSSIVCAATAICQAGSETQKSSWLSPLASGDVVACFAYCEGKSGWRPSVNSVVFKGGKLNGTKTPVADAGISSIAIVTCRLDDEERLAIVDLSQSGVSKTRLESFDELRAHYQLDFQDADAELLELSSPQVIDTLFDKIAVQLAFECIGGSEACIGMARDYALGRMIFNRPLAGYQAVKHRLADALHKVEFARSNAYYAGWASMEAADQLAAAAGSARLLANEAFQFAARENLQLHGGIGYIFEANCHFYYRRERLNALMLGPEQYWADRILNNIPVLAEGVA